MGKIFSIQVAVPTIVVLSVGGFQMLNQGFFPYYWVLWGIAITWLIPCLILRRQSVDITIHECELRDASDSFYVRIEGFIHSRHPDGLKDIKLWLISSLGFSSVQSSRELHSIDSKPQMFSVSYCVSYELTEQAMAEQKTNGANVAWVLSADARDSEWLFPGSIMQIGLLKETRKVKATMVDNKKRNGEKKKGSQLGINKRQFHDLLKKTS